MVRTTPAGRRSPIVVFGFQRGGTNILTNLLSSHPDTQRLGAEFHELFLGRDEHPVRTWAVRLAGSPVILATGAPDLWPYRYHERSPLPGWVRPYARSLLFASRWRRFRWADRPAGHRSHLRRAQSRPIVKAVNGLVFALPVFESLYPDARYVILVRDPFALGQGFIRRGWSAERFASMYDQVGNRMASTKHATTRRSSGSSACWRNRWRPPGACGRSWAWIRRKLERSSCKPSRRWAAMDAAGSPSAPPIARSRGSLRRRCRKCSRATSIVANGSSFPKRTPRASSGSPATPHAGSATPRCRRRTPTAARSVERSSAEACGCTAHAMEVRRSPS